MIAAGWRSLRTKPSVWCHDKGGKPMKPIAALIACTLAGCVSVGTNYSEDAAARLQPGMTKATVIQMLGKPTSTVTMSDGREQLGWVYSKGSMFGAKARALNLPFGRDGRLLQVPGGAPVGGPPAVATTSTANVDTFASHVETSSTVTTSAPAAPNSAALPPGVKQLGPDVWLYPAPTQSGQCIQAPAGYQGTGAANRPAITAALPRCGAK